MFSYWFLYAIAVIPALFVGSRRSQNVTVWAIVGLVFAIVIGFRYQVGGDWFNYLRKFDGSVGRQYLDAVTISDPGYALLSWLMGLWGWEIYGVNTVCGAIFILGLIVFCRQQPMPWLGFAVAVPYLVVVMAMGYTRQSVALGFFFLALAAINRGRFLHYLAWIALGATFHKSAVLLVPLGIALYGKGWAWRVVAVATAGFGLWDLFLEEHQERLWASYVDAQMESQGARIRVLMNLVPSLLVLLYAKRWRRFFSDYTIWFWLAVASLGSFALVDFATTAVDRVSLYFTPLQVVVYARLSVLMRGQVAADVVRLGVVAGYSAVLFVWLNYAAHAKFWLPYRNILFE